MPLKNFLEFWLDTVVRTRVDPATHALHKQRSDDYLVPHLGTVPLAKLTPFHVSQLYTTLEKEGQSPDLRKKVGELLRRGMRYAVDFGLLSTSPAAKVALPKASAKQMRPLDEAEVGRFLTAAAKNRLFPLYLLALDTGMRQGEIIALEWSDIDFTTGVVSVTKTAKGGGKGGVRIKEVKTKASRRRIRLSRPALDALTAWRERSRGRIVFPSRGTGPRYGKDRYLDKGCLLRSFKKLLRQAALPEIRFHELRHTHATLALLKTKNIKAVSARLGHRDIRVTLNTYAHYLPVMEEEIVSAMEGLLVVQQLCSSDTPVHQNDEPQHAYTSWSYVI